MRREFPGILLRANQTFINEECDIIRVFRVSPRVQRPRSLDSGNATGYYNTDYVEKRRQGNARQCGKCDRISYVASCKYLYRIFPTEVFVRADAGWEMT
jgi:hypothetical protein